MRNKYRTLRAIADAMLIIGIVSLLVYAFTGHDRTGLLTLGLGANSAASGLAMYLRDRAETKTAVPSEVQEQEEYQ